MRGNKRRNGRRSDKVRFIAIEEPILASVAYRSLTPTAKALLLELLHLFNGSNNGELFLSQRDAAALLCLADTAPVRQAFRDLIEVGLVVQTQSGSFHNRQGRAASFRLTFHHCGGAGPTHDWKGWRPQPGTPPFKRLERVAKTNLRCGNAARTVVDYRPTWPQQAVINDAPGGKTPTAQTEKRGISTKPSDGLSSTQVSCHTPVAEMATGDERARLRAGIKSWLSSGGGTQQILARMSRVDQSKLSRFLGDTANRRQLTQDQASRLGAALGALRRGSVVATEAGADAALSGPLHVNRAARGGCVDQRREARRDHSPRLFN